MEDYVRQGLSEVTAKNRALAHIESVLKDRSKGLHTYRLPETNEEFIEHDDIDHYPIWSPMLRSLTDEQREFFEMILNNIDIDNPMYYILDGPGGSGKSYYYTFLTHYALDHGFTVSNSASTGIAAQILPDGQTTHKTFAIPIPCDETTNCNISPNSEYGQALIRTNIFIVDECFSLSKHQFEAIHRLMQDLMDNQRPFGGKIFIFGGDPRQTLPVVRHASNTVMVENCITSSHLWPGATRFSFKNNMRANSNENDFKEFLLKIGNGELPTKNTAPFADSVEIPQNFVTNSDLSKEIFPNNELAQQSDSIIESAILCPTNIETIDMMNLFTADESCTGYSQFFSFFSFFVTSGEREDTETLFMSINVS